MRGSRWMDSKAEEGANDDEGGRRMMILALLLYEVLVMILDLLSPESYKSKITTEKARRGRQWPGWSVPSGGHPGRLVAG